MKIKISVIVPTYNHEHFIQKCIDSIITQEVDAEVEVLVGEDCSADNTANILKEKYSGSCQLILRSQNIGASLNVIDLLDKCTGDYIAYIDGDDYMLPGKLAAQLKVFEKNENVNLVHHNVSEVNFDNKLLRAEKFNGNLVGDINDLLKNCQGGMQSCSVMVRRTNVLDWYQLIPVESKIQDMPFIYNSLGGGEVFYISSKLAAYRKHESSITSISSNEALESWTRYFIRQASTNPLAKKSCINTSLAASYLRCTISKIQDKEFKNAIVNFKLAVFCLPYPSKVLIRTYLGLTKVLFKILFKK